MPRCESSTTRENSRVRAPSAVCKRRRVKLVVFRRHVNNFGMLPGATPSSLATAAVVGIAVAFAVSRSRTSVRGVKLLLSALRPEFVLFGDSITQQSFGPGGWSAAVADVYQRTADIRLRGYSGYNTRWALPLLPGLFPSIGRPPALVTIFFGANDANLPAPLRNQDASASRQFVPLDEYAANLRTIMDTIRAMNSGAPPRILLITPPPCDGEGWHAHCVKTYAPDYKSDCEPNRSFENTARYAAACVELGAETNTPVLDLHSAMASRADWRSLLSDGLHPNAAGGKVIASAVLDAIATFYPELQPGSFFDADPAKLPLDYPDHKAIDVANVEGSFTAHKEAQGGRSKP
jgi:lysophospholipase L1-like esterase